MRLHEPRSKSKRLGIFANKVTQRVFLYFIFFFLLFFSVLFLDKLDETILTLRGRTSLEDLVECRFGQE